MRAYVGITDSDWYEFLFARTGLDEVNFWRPRSTLDFRAIDTGELFLFKLHAPDNFIVGGGVFAHYAQPLPISVVWEAFQEKNGAPSEAEMRARVLKYRREVAGATSDPSVGSILITQPFFFPRSEWIPAPTDWKSATQQGKGYDLTSGIGLDLWNQLQLRLSARPIGALPVAPGLREPFPPAYGEPALIRPRLGQGTFRVLVTDNYDRRCAVTGERTLPVLQAAHIKPFSLVMEHDARNGLLLRSDIHTLFDRGYVTVTPEHRFEVSRRLKEDWENGHDYYALRGNQVRIPEKVDARPDAAFLQWHAENVFRG